MPSDHIAFIPTYRIFDLWTAERCLTPWGTDCRGICLPLVGVMGVPFKSWHWIHYDRPAEALEGGRVRYLEFHQIIAKFAELGCNIYLYIDGSFASLGCPDACFALDSVGRSSGVCVNNIATQTYVSEIIAAGLTHAYNTEQKYKDCIKGIVFDACGIFDTLDHDTHVDLTCFCNSCAASSLAARTALNVAAADLSLLEGTYSDYDRLSRVNRIDHDFSINAFATILGKHGLNQFAGPIAAPALHNFLRVRHKVAQDAISNLLDRAIDGSKVGSIDKILLTEGLRYSWHSGLFTANIDRTFKEVWIDRVADAPHLANQPYRYFLSRHATRPINHLLNTLRMGHRPSLEDAQATMNGIHSNQILSDMHMGQIGCVQPILTENLMNIPGTTSGVGGRSSEDQSINTKPLIETYGLKQLEPYINHS